MCMPVAMCCVSFALGRLSTQALRRPIFYRCVRISAKTARVAPMLHRHTVDGWTAGLGEWEMATWLSLIMAASLCTGNDRHHCV